ncbi:MAG: AI-2E family transporter [Arenimonas sp.]
MPEPIPHAISSATRWQWAAALVGLGALLWLLGPMLVPFALSALLAWLANPMVEKLQRAGRTRTTGVLIVFTLMALILVLALLILIPLVQSQLQELFDWLPRLATWINTTAVPWVERKLRIKLASYIDPMAIAGLLRTHWEQAGGVAATIIAGVSKSGLAILGWVANLLLIPVLTFYFLRDWPEMLGRVRELLPRPLEPTVSALAVESDQMLGGFIRGQLSVMVSLGLIYGTGLWAIGLDVGLLIGFIAGLMSFVPYLGAAVGITAALIAAGVQYGDMQHLLMVGAVFAVGQTIENFLLVPWLVGDRIGMHPVAVIFAIMAGGQLFGFLGVLLALPVAAVAMVLLRYAHKRYTDSALYGAAPAKPVSGVPADAVSPDSPSPAVPVATPPAKPGA